MRQILSLLIAAIAFVASPSSSRAQQLWHSQNDNNTYGNLAVGWPAAVLGFRFTAPSAATVTAAQVFTGNSTPDLHTLELRVHDPVTGLPGALLGPAGSWNLQHTRSFQGPLFPQPIALQGGQDYWLVWRVLGMFPQHSVAADSPSNTLSEVRINDGTSWFAVANLAAKFRLFTQHAYGTSSTLGVGKPGQYGIPSIAASAWPAVGSPLDITIDNCARRQPSLLLLGLPIPSGIPIGIGTLYTTADTSLFLTTNLQSNPSSGGAAVTFFVPNDPGLANVPIAFQWAVVDPLAQDSLSHTPGLQVVLQ